ncbi:hypothetical protein D1871_10970 [Nakamurella silvestris]|nr:hypothetical protein D1871_10970 [Nakamurella silvestris]
MHPGQHRHMRGGHAYSEWHAIDHTSAILPALTEVEAALISVWADATWVTAAQSIVSGKPVRPTALGGSIGEPWLDRPGSAAWEVLQSQAFEADGTAIRAGKYYSPETWNTQKEFDAARRWRHVCTWQTVTTWLKTFAPEVREEVSRCRSDFYAVYLERDDEKWEPWHTIADGEARRDRYNARMAAGDQAVMDRCQARFKEIVAESLRPFWGDQHTSVPAEPAELVVHVGKIDQFALFALTT